MLHIDDYNNSRTYQMIFGYSGNQTHRFGRSNATGKFEGTALTNSNGFLFTSSAPNTHGIFEVTSLFLKLNAVYPVGTNNVCLGLDAGAASRFSC